MLFKAGLNSLSGQCIYIKITNTPQSEACHVGSAEANKKMIVTVCVHMVT